MTPQALQVSVSHSQYILQGLGGQLTDPPYAGGNGLIWAGDGAALVMTGQNSGLIAVTVTVLDTPPAPDLARWDDVAEISLAITGDGITVQGPTALEEGTDIPLPTPSGDSRSPSAIASPPQEAENVRPLPRFRHAAHQPARYVDKVGTQHVTTTCSTEPGGALRCGSGAGADPARRVA
jgi:hypothetical protein